MADESFDPLFNGSYPFDLEAECNEIHDINDSLRCLFAMTVEDCVEIIEYLDYNYYIFCYAGFERVVGAVIVCLLLLLMLFLALGITSNCFLCPALFAVSKHLRLSQNVAGVTLLAFGNGAPDIFSSAAGLQKASAELAIASLVGAGTFVTTVVAGSVFLTQPFSMMVRPFLRDICFYVIAVCWTFALFFCGRDYVFHGIGFVVLYFAYIVVVLGSRFIYVTLTKDAKPKGRGDGNEVKFKGKKHKFPDDPGERGIVLKAYFFAETDWFDSPLSSSEFYGADNDAYTGSTTDIGVSVICKSNGLTSTEKLHQQPLYSERGEFYEFLCKVCPVNHEKWHRSRWWFKIAAIVKSPVILILRITIPVLDSGNEDDKNNWCRYLNSIHCITGPVFVILVSGSAFDLVGDVFPVIAIVIILGFILSTIVFCTSERYSPPVYHWMFAYLGFAVAVTWIYALANEIVALLQVFGVVFNLSDAILGLTILAWGNSLSDFLSNLAVARKNYPRMAISACFGGPLLALLLGLGIPCIIEDVKGRAPAKFPLTFSGQFAILFVTLTISIVLTTSLMIVWKFQSRRFYGGVLLALYFCFLTLSVMEEAKVFSIDI